MAGGPAARPAAPRRLAGWAIALAILAGLAAAVGTELAYASARQDGRDGPFNPKFEGNEPPGYEQMGNYEKRDAIVEFELTTKPPAEVKNAAMAYGLLGALLGAAMGVAGALAGGAATRAAPAAVVGLVAGAVAGAAGSAVMGPIFFRLIAPETGIGLPMVTHGVIWAAVGMAAGAAAGVGVGGRGRIPTAVVGGLIGGILGTLAFEVVNAIAFPEVRVFEPLSTERGPRVASALCVAVGVALGIILAFQERPQKKPTAAPEVG